MAATDQVRDQAHQGAEKAKQGLRGQVDERSTQAGEQLSTQAGDVRTVAEELRKQGKDGPAKVAEQAADRAERVGSYLKQSDADRILGDIESYARDNPFVVMAGGLAAGFLASRFLKASGAQRASQPQLPQPATSSRPGYADTPATGPSPLGGPATGVTTPPTSYPSGTGVTSPVEAPTTVRPGGF